MDMPGGLSVVMAAVLGQFVVGPNSILNAKGHSKPDGNHRVYACTRRVPSDGGALQHAFRWFGPGSIKRCMECRNSVQRGAALEQPDPGARYNIVCSNIGESVVNSNADLRRAQKLLKVLNRMPNVCATELKEHEKTIGFHYYSGAVRGCRRLSCDVTSSLCLWQVMMRCALSPTASLIRKWGASCPCWRPRCACS